MLEGKKEHFKTGITLFFQRKVYKIRLVLKLNFQIAPKKEILKKVHR